MYNFEKYLIEIVEFLGSARPRMVILFIAAIYPHYYAWWAYVNYYNDDFYKQFYHQLFFTITEFVAVQLCCWYEHNRKY